MTLMNLMSHLGSFNSGDSMSERRPTEFGAKQQLAHTARNPSFKECDLSVPQAVGTIVLYCAQSLVKYISQILVNSTSSR